MSGDSLHRRKAQLDKEEREHLEQVVADMRDRVEDNVRYQLESRDLDSEPDADALDESDWADDETRQLAEAIELEAVDGDDWAAAFERYVTGVGYTIVNRLAALRCMEVRGFVDEEVTVFKENGLTPSAETLVHEEFMLEDEAILAAYREACESLAEEIEILFDLETAYSQVDPDAATFEELCAMLDEVPDEVWRADDVLGWVYEYYNVKLLDDLRRKGDREGLDPHEVPPANQFYTPHWVVRMLTDNSLGKLYLEDSGDLSDVVEAQRDLSPAERKERSPTIAESRDLADLCTYLVPSEEAGDPPEFDGPEDIRVIDPACGSGHFLLYAFDVLERIWRAERPDLDAAEVPRKILRHNLYGVDLDMRACQLAAFSLYLKARTRAESEGASGFDMPDVGIVCADAKVADVEFAEEVFDEVAGDRPQVRESLQRILDSFEDIHGLGSLLDVRGTLADEFEEGTQLTLGDSFDRDFKLHDFLHSLREAIAERRDGDSFLARDLRSFVRLLEVLSQDFDVALMNPPYGSVNRMPDSVEDYVETNYQYSAEYYINFFEVGQQVTKENGRVGMLVPWTFMFKHKYRDFREDFVGTQGSFDFLAEFGYGILDNATVGTVGTVIRTNTSAVTDTGSFLRLHDIDAKEKESEYLQTLSGKEGEVSRFFEVDLNEFANIPGTSICYSIPKEVRKLHDTDLRIDAEQAGIEGESVCYARQGLTTADDDRFIRLHWEAIDSETFKPISKGGPTAWTVPQVLETVEWGSDGKRIKQSPGEVRTRNEELYGEEGLTWTYIKRTGRRFGYFPANGLYSNTGYMLIPREDMSLWNMLATINSSLYHNLFLSLTTERHWNSGEVGSLPWIPALEEIDELGELAQEQYQTTLQQRIHDPVSPYYVGPELLPTDDAEFFYDHPHSEQAEEWIDLDRQSGTPDQSIAELARESEQRSLERRQRLEDLSDEIDRRIYDELDIGEETREDIRTEIFLRTAEDPEDREVPDPETVPEVPDSTPEKVRRLVHHFALEVVREADDGVVPVHAVEGEASMHDRVVAKFREAYGDHAEDRLVEADAQLGTESAEDEAYPNLRRFVADDLFDYHVETMDNTPVIWTFTTERLVSDPAGEGFACFVDFHSLDSGLFDRMVQGYVEPRKADLRERRTAAERRRNDDSLSASEQAEATETYDRCVSGLQQIERFEETVQQLVAPNPRDWGEADRERAGDLAPKVAEFRAATEAKFAVLDDLAEDHDDAWFEDTFSPSFHGKVEENREEWLDALADLEDACEAYARPGEEPVEAHLGDLFSYFEDLAGSTHYSSTGILFATYYYDKAGSEFLTDDGNPREGLTGDAALLAELAEGLDEYVALAEEIEADCNAIDREIPADWADRARAEITTAGYDPERKHGVAVNLEPLADEQVVPETVEDKVL